MKRVEPDLLVLAATELQSSGATDHVEDLARYQALSADDAPEQQLPWLNWAIRINPAAVSAEDSDGWR